MRAASETDSHRVLRYIAAQAAMSAVLRHEANTAGKQAQPCDNVHVAVSAQPRKMLARRLVFRHARFPQYGYR